MLNLNTLKAKMNNAIDKAKPVAIKTAKWIGDHPATTTAVVATAASVEAYYYCKNGKMKASYEKHPKLTTAMIVGAVFFISKDTLELSEMFKRMTEDK